MPSQNVGSIHYDLKLDTKKFDRSVKNVSQKTESLGTKFKSTAAKLAKVTAAIAGVGFGLKKGFIDPATDLEETINKVDVAFGKNAKEVRDWSKTTIDSFGIAGSTAMDAAALFGDMGTSMGISTKQAAKMSTRLTGLAGDLSSFKNIGIEQSMTALKGVFTGETESLKNLGVVMTQTQLAQFALEKGIKTNIKDMTQQELVTLRYKFVLDKTKNAQGDFARTSDGAANRTRALGERFKELREKLGKKLMPVYQDVLDIGFKLVASYDEWWPKIVKVKDWIVELARQVAEYLRPKLEALWNTIQNDLMPALKNFWKNIIEPMLPVIGTELVLAWGAVIDIFNALIDVLSPVIDWLGKNDEVVWTLIGTYGILKGAMMLSGVVSAAQVVFAEVGVAMTALRTGQLASLITNMGIFKALVTSPIAMPAIAVAAALFAIQKVYNKAQETLALIDKLDAENRVNRNTQSSSLKSLKNMMETGTPEQKKRAEKRFRALAAGMAGNNAMGTNNWRGGMTWVGERGPELINLPRGSQVKTHEESKAMMGGSTYNIENHFDGVMARSRADLRDIARDLVGSLNEELRAKNMQTIPDGRT